VTGFKKPEKNESIADALAHVPTKRYPCLVNGCPMCGAIFSGSGGGICAYHYGTNPEDWPRITHTLTDWQCVTDEINGARQALTNSRTASSPSALDALFAAAWRRLEPLALHWAADLKPQPGRGGRMDTYSTWALRLECFIGARVVESIRGQLGRKAA